LTLTSLLTPLRARSGCSTTTNLPTVSSTPLPSSMLSKYTLLANQDYCPQPHNTHPHPLSWPTSARFVLSSPPPSIPQSCKSADWTKRERMSRSMYTRPNQQSSQQRFILISSQTSAMLLSPWRLRMAPSRCSDINQDVTMMTQFPKAPNVESCVTWRDYIELAQKYLPTEVR